MQIAREGEMLFFHFLAKILTALFFLAVKIL